MLRFLLVALIFPLAGFGAEVSGIWMGQVAARNGGMQDVRFKFVQEGDTLTGKMYGEDESTPIRDGKISGDQITFSITNELNGGHTTFLFTGTITGNEIQLTRERQRTGN